jgi:magnesium transporter
MTQSLELTEQNATTHAVLSGMEKAIGELMTPVLVAFHMRHPWLQLNLITAFAAAFLPVLTGQIGNTGCQALAITLRGMTLGQINDYPVKQLLRKEILLGALNGAVVGVVAGIAMFAYALFTDSANPAMLGFVIFIAMIGACIVCFLYQ